MNEQEYSKDELEKAGPFRTLVLKRKFARQIYNKLDMLENSDISADEYERETAGLERLTKSYDTLNKPGKVFEIVKTAVTTVLSAGATYGCIMFAANVKENLLDIGGLTKAKERAIDQIASSKK